MPVTNTLAYLASSTVTKKKKFHNILLLGEFPEEFFDEILEKVVLKLRTIVIDEISLARQVLRLVYTSDFPVRFSSIFAFHVLVFFWFNWVLA